MITLDHILDSFLTGTTLVWGVFLTWYTLRAKWWHTRVGRNTFGVSLILFAILLRATFVRWNDDVIDVLGIVLYAVAGIFGVQRIIVMERAQRAHKDTEDKEDNDK